MRAERGPHALVGDVRHQPPRAAGLLAAEEYLPLTAVASLHPVHHPAAIGRSGQAVLRDPLVGERAGQIEAVTRVAEVTEPHLLPEARRIGAQGVPEPRPVVTPGHRPAYQVHVRDRLVHDLSGAGVVDVQCPVLGAVLRQGHGDLGAVRGRHEEVDGGLTRRVDDVRIHHHPLGRHIVEVGQGDQEWLLPGCLHLQREEGASTRPELQVRRSFELQQLLGPGPQRGPPADLAEIGGAAVLLSPGPGDRRVRGSVLQPPVVLGHRDPVIGAAYRNLRCVDRPERVPGGTARICDDRAVGTVFLIAGQRGRITAPAIAIWPLRHQLPSCLLVALSHEIRFTAAPASGARRDAIP